jgi:PAS domain S-box-containing protein
MAGVLDLGAVFDASPNPYMVLDRELRYVAVNRAYLAATSRTRDELIGRALTDVFPHDPDDPNNENRRQLEASLRRVFASGQPDALPFIHYRILVPGPGGAAYGDRYWSATHTPLPGPDGRVEHVLQHTVDVTEMYRRSVTSGGAATAPVEAGVLGRAQMVQQRNQVLDQDLRRLLSIFEQTPGFLCYLSGPEHVYELANAAYSQLVGGRALVGRTVREALPEIGEAHFQLLDRVYESGEPFVGWSTPVDLRRTAGGPAEQAFVDFVYQPINDATGKTAGVLVMGQDVTAQKRGERAQTEALQLARVLDATRDFVGIADLDGRPIFVNQAALQLMGFPDMDTARRLQVIDYFVPAQRAHVTDVVLPAAIRDGYWEGERLFRHTRTGEEIPVWQSIFPLRDGSGTVTALATITRDLRAQKAAEAERAQLLQNEREARAQAEQANELKDQFLAVVSHELRTPLTAILGWMQMWKSGTLSPEKRQRAVDAIDRNARVQAQLIEDLLDVSRIMSDKLQLDREQVEVAAVVGAALETVRPVAEAKGVTLASSVEFSGRVMGDSRRLQQVVWNLLSNAVKFTAAGGHVLLTVEREGDMVEIAVVDSGIGISAEFLPHVFERFRQAAGGSLRTQSGLGLGLSIVCHVVQAHGGTVTAASPGEGKGATFVVRLPIAPSNDKGESLPGPGAAAFEAPDLQGTRLLVVEDEADTREYMKALLQQCGAAVTVADSAAAAMQALGRDRPDVILSDIGMPGEDGYGLIQRIRRLPEDQGGRTPAVALTAHARKEDRTRAMLAGFQNHVTKPVAADELLAVVAALASSRRN